MAMTRVLERLYLGDARDADHLSVSNPFCITAVVTTQSVTKSTMFIFLWVNHAECLR
jgi:hypothetical protein